jgi:hypothetical protein
MMRYRFVDEVLSLELGGPRPRITVVKTFPAGDDAFSGPLGVARVPNSLLLELLAMTGGHLAFRHGGGRQVPLLLKVPECRFEGVARAGERLRAVGCLEGVSALGADAGLAEASVEAFAGAARVATARLLYLCVAVSSVDLAAFAPSPGSGGREPAKTG